MFTFPIVAVRKIIERGIADAAANGGFSNPYCDIRPGEDEKPGLWLVGDNGVYVMSNGKLAEGEDPLIVYSEQCHPVGHPDWRDYKRRHFGNDHDAEFIEAEQLIPRFDRHFRATHVNFERSGARITFSLITR